MIFSPHVIRSGRNEPLPERRVLRAGPLRMIYENGFLRTIRLGDREVLRMIYFAVRDQHWSTIPVRVEEEEIVRGTDSFRIRYRARCERPSSAEASISYQWRCEIDGQADGSLRFRILGEAQTAFQRNRIGFCVLHPVRECTGRPCTIVHPDGSRSTAVFPTLISPHQPFLDIREMEWEVTESCSARLHFEGDVFETEDQRNWTDASYKTYCTPLSRPFPAKVMPGDRVEQTVELRLAGLIPEGQQKPAEPETVRIDWEDTPVGPLPALGTETVQRALSESNVRWLREARFSHLRVEIRLGQPKENWLSEFEHARRTALQLDARLEVILFLHSLPNYDLYTFLQEVRADDPIASVSLLFNKTAGHLLDQLVPPLRQALPGVAIGSGTDTYFTELNRRPPPTDQLDFLTYSINPQVHAFDNYSVMETPEAQADTVLSARRLGLPVHISPITLRPRYNPDAAQEAAAIRNGLPDSVDPRQMSLFAASWTVASLKALAQAGVRSATYYRTQGTNGVLFGQDSTYDGHFAAKQDMLFPVYWVFRAINEFRNGEVVLSQSADPRRVESLLLRRERAYLLLLANLTHEEQSVFFPASGHLRVQRLDERTFEEACLSPETFQDRWVAAREAPSGREANFSLSAYGLLLVRWESDT